MEHCDKLDYSRREYDYHIEREKKAISDQIIINAQMEY